jgi:uroporphyrinogen III methyltransferase/synthase
VTGFVSLVGAGPGDPLLLTLRGRRAIEAADVILYDHLASPALLSAFDVPGQERIHVGKAGGESYASQESICALIVKRARLGQRVVRLKGGDPFIFGRGAEEAEVLVEAGIPFEIIPGVSSVYAAPAAAGIPLTHRDHASTFCVATGHERDDAGRVDWEALGRVGGTVVVLMGVRHVARWTAGLMRGGRPPTTPVAFVRWGTLPRQEVLVTTLGEAADAVAAHHFRAPAVAIIGEVVQLRDRLATLERLPLFGQVVGLTRDAQAHDEAAFEPLERLGAALLNIPLTRKVRGPGFDALVGMLEAPPRTFTDLVFTSANGVRALRDALFAAHLDTRALAGLRTWAVGPATAAAMREHLALTADEVPPVATAEGLVAHARTRDVAGRTFLFPASEKARRVLPEGLAALSATLVELPVYDICPEPAATASLLSALDEGLTLLVVASPSAVTALADILDQASLPRDKIALAAIGPTTATAALDAGMRVLVTPDEAHGFTLAGLAEAIIEAGRQSRLEACSLSDAPSRPE